MNKYKIIVNPVSGRGNGEKSIPSIEEWLRASGLSCELVRTQYAGHAIELTRQAVKEGFNIVVAAGGDGTANEVINGLVQAEEQGLGKAAMAILSIGRGNDMAFGMDIPIQLEEGLTVLAQDYRKHIDIGKMTGCKYPEGRYFGNGVGIGFDAVVDAEAAKMTYLSGFVCYLAAALKTIFIFYPPPTMKIEFNGTVLVQPAMLVSVMNGRRLGGGFLVAPRAIPHDGQFDVLIADQVSQIAILPLLTKFMQGSQESHPAIHTSLSPKITVSAVTGALPVHADGEMICENGDKLEIEILPQRIEVICRSPK